MNDPLAPDLAALATALLDADADVLDRFPDEPEARRARLVHWYETRQRLADFAGAHPDADPEGALTGPDAVYTCGVGGLVALEAGCSGEALGHLIAGMAAAGRMLDEHGSPSLQRERENTIARLHQDLGSLAEGLALLALDPATVLGLEQDHQLSSRQLDRAAIEALVAERVAARAARDWSRADELGDELTALGVVLMDRGGSTSWKMVGEA